MKTKLHILFVLLLVVLSTNIKAQHSRRDLKSCVPYRANYMRATTGSVSSHNIEIRKGNIWTWGSNNNGQLGDGTLINKTNAVQVGNDNTWVLVATGSEHSLGIKANGTLWAWGLNTDGQLGDGTYVNKTSPVQVGTDSNWISIKAGANFSVGIKANGTIWTWGINNWGQLGTGNSVQKSNLPNQIGTEQIWTSIACGSNHAIALKANGTLWAWGKNDFGQLGDSSLVNKNQPIIISTDSNWTKISAGALHNLALRANGTLWAWGNNTDGELGDGSFIQKNYPTKVGNERNWIVISAGGNHSMAIKVFGTLYSWGKNNNGQLGIGNNSVTNQNFPIKIGAKNNWVYASAGYNFSMALGADGKLFLFGANSLGELGNGNLINQNIPILKSLPANEWLIVKAFREYSIGIKINGTLWAWGKNVFGVLGNGTTISKSNPNQIGSDNNWTSISLANSDVLALKSDGTIWVWGNNCYISGFTSVSSQNSPIKNGIDSNWSEISNLSSSIALKSDGSLWGWGYNYFLFDSAVTAFFNPIMLSTNTDWVSVNQNGAVLVLKSNGSLWSFRANNIGQLGNGTVSNGATAILKIGISNDWIQIQGGNGFGSAIKSNGTLWAWGWNDNGQLGDGTTLNKNTPTQIGFQNDWLITSGGGIDRFSLGLKTNGTLWAWGANNYGQFGNNSYTASLIPTKIGTNNNWVNTSAGSYHAIGLKSYRTEFCATGNNGSGELGDSTNDSRAEYICNQMPLICSPPIAPSVSNQTICKNTATTLTSAGIGTLSWYSDSVGGNYLGSGLSFNTPTLTNTTNYYIQDSTCAASTRTKVTVFVLPKPKIGFTLSNINQCVNTNLVFTDTTTVGLGNINRLWKLNNIDTSTSINFTKKFNSAGSFTIQLIVANSLNSSCKDSLSKAFNIYPKSNVSINANATVICQGQTITLRGNGAKTYNWNNNVINNEPFKPTVNGSYKVIGIDSNGCVDSAFINVVVNLNPSASIQATENPVCAKTPIKLTASGGNLYFWSDGIINGQLFVPIGSKTYNVTVFDEKGCSDTASIKLEVKPLPNVEITKNKTVLTATLSGANYQWINCNNKTIIVGATNQSYTALSNGSYSVIIILNGCRDTSTCINVNSVGINENDFKTLNIYPNPATSQLNITSNSNIKTVLIYNITGQLVKELNYENEHLKDVSLAIDDLAQGMYMVQIIDAMDAKLTSKFIKE